MNRNIPDHDIWRAALLIREHGADAEVVVARRADEMLERGDSGQPTHLASHQAGGRGVASRTCGKAELVIKT
jgi:hypothetical protein